MHGNMHPSLGDPSSAQANYNAYCTEIDVDPSLLVGLRIDPLWEDGARVLDISNSATSFKRGSVKTDDRLAAHAIIAPRSVGLFALSGDCFPVAINGETTRALCHIGWRSIRDSLVPTVIEMLKKQEPDTEVFDVEIGPGVRYNTDYLPTIIKQATTKRTVVSHCDSRDTYADTGLFSRRAHFNGLPKPRGNHVVILPPIRSHAASPVA